MKLFKSYIIAALALAASALGLASCQDHFDAPSGEVDPVATMEANTTILEFKKMLWKSSVNYCEPIYTKDYYSAPAGTPAEELERLKTEGEHIIIKGRVASSDYAGNVFRSIVLQDAEGTCLNFSIYSYNLYLTYRRGQEIVVDLTGLHAGKYSGLFQIGAPEFSQAINADETTFLAPAVFNHHRELNGAPAPDKVETVELDNFNDITPETDEIRQIWQSRLVRLKNVQWVIPSTESPGVETLSTYHETKSQQVMDANGVKMTVRTSGYCNFWNTVMPEGKGDVIGILGYYQTKENSTDSGWQLTLIDINSIQFGSQEGNPGTEDNPYTVDQAIGFVTDGSQTTGWVRGYIVGTVAPEVTEVKTNADVQFKADPDLGNTIVIGQDPETTDIAHCLVVTLAQGTDLRTLGALRENPANYKKQIDIHGTFATVMGTYGITGNNGTSAEFHIDGVTPAPTPGGEIPDGDGQEATPYNVAQVIAKNPTDKENALESGVWVSGYIVGSCTDKAYSSAEFTADANSSETNILVAPTADCTNAAQCIPVALPVSVRAALNLKANPGNLGKKIELKGDIIKYFGVPGVKNMSEYKLDGQSSGDTPTPTPGDIADGNGQQATPYNVAQVIAKNPTDKNTALESGVWIAGYIVGSCTDMSYTESAEFAATANSSETNLLLGPSADCKDAAQCIPVALPAAVRAALNLRANPGNLGKKLVFKGDIIKYFGVPGAKNMTEYTLDGQSGGGDTPTPDPNPNPDPTPGPTGPTDQGGTSGTFNFADPTTLNPAYSEKDQVADGTTGNFKIDVKGIVFTNGSAAISNDGTGTAARLYHQSKGDWTYRFYKNTVTTIAVAEGYHITKVEFEPQTTGYDTALGNATYSSGSYANKVWTPSAQVSSFTITPSATTGLTKVVVYYEK